MIAHARGRAPSSNRPAQGQRGGIVVEMSLVALLIFTLGAGAYDYGQGWRSSLAVNEASRTGARVGSAMGDDLLADYYALSGAKSALQSSGRLDDVERVVIFRSTTEDGRIPTACRTQLTTTATCNIVDGATFRSAWTEDNFDPVTGCFLTHTAQQWCPSTRDNLQRTAEYFGIWIQYRHDYEFPILGQGQDISRQTVMRLEPKES